MPNNPWPAFFATGSFFLPPFLYLTVRDGLGIALLAWVVLRISTILCEALEERDQAVRRGTGQGGRGFGGDKRNPD